MAIPEACEFCTEVKRTFAPAYDNRLTVESLESLVADCSEEAVPLIAPTALLMIHGEKDLISPAMVRRVFERAGEPKLDGRWQEFDGIGLFRQLGIIPPTAAAGA